MGGLSFAGRIMWQTAISFCVAGKGAIKADREKVAFTLFNLFERIGVVKGYIWQSMNGDRR
jgi:hypothetical protein